jgi:oxygen-independent coproporphyrinogen-3 oxidase
MAIVEARHRIPSLSEEPRTLFLGGGTPSMLSPLLLKRLFTGLQEVMNFEQMDEVNMEANPATFDEAKALVFRECGVKRVSLGVQSFSETMLQVLGREHGPEQAAESVRILQRVGMPSINVDLMFSLPEQTMEQWRHTLETAIRLEPDHISAYNLTYEEDTAFFDSFQAGALAQSVELNGEMFYEAKQMLEDAGYVQYETSNYARPGHESIHNQGYWSGEDYVGLGPSAVSTIGAERSRNIENTEKYLSMVKLFGHALAERENIGKEERRLERLAMGLRTREGISRNLLDEAGVTRMRVLIDEGLAEERGERMILTKKGASLVDGIAGEIC